ncbi:hypothetical protein COMNV_00867 [Commensalibacter sp. Nvir]|uniref:baseplate hub protein n=1 Tax=Commensalibacter sp. Nvir TaxID=3069817 RepID=UPI002D33ECD5|nr:hypothetical protein COMNV_00867 [Commensalibacter sp. Nvir]
MSTLPAPFVGSKNVGFFQKNLLHFSFFQENQSDPPIEFHGLDARMTIQYAGGKSYPVLHASIFNIAEQYRHRLASFGQYNQTVPKKRYWVRVSAKRSQGKNDRVSYSRVFSAPLVTTYTDYHHVPDIITVIEAKPLAGFNLVGSPAVSFSGTVTAEQIVRTMVSNFKQKFSSDPELGTAELEHVVNHGVTHSLTNPHYYGDIKSQLDRCAHDANFTYHLQDGFLYMRPWNATASGLEPLKLSPKSGLIGDPDYSSQGLHLKTLFNPSLRFGQPISIQDSTSLANGVWTQMISLTHHLSTTQSRDQWFTELQVTR